MKLDEMNYTLYISNHHRKKVKESSFKPSDDYQMKANMIMNQSNIGVDTIIAEMILIINVFFIPSNIYL